MTLKNISNTSFKKGYKLLIDTINYIPSKLVPALVNLGIILIFTRVMNPEKYGVYSLIITTANILVTLMTQWIIQSTLFYRPHYLKEGKEDNFNIYFVKTLILVILLSAIVSIFAYITLDVLDSKYLPFILSTYILVISNSFFVATSTILQSDFQVKSYSAYFSLMNILKFILYMVIIYSCGPNIQMILWMTALSYILLIFPMLKQVNLLNRNVFLNSTLLKLDHSYKFFLKKYISYGFPMIGWFIGTSLINMSDRYIIEIFRGSREVGIYSANYSLVSTSLGLAFAPLLNAIHPILMNEASKELNKEKLSFLISNFTHLFLLISLPIVGFVTLFNTEITTLLFGEEFREGKLIIPILLIGFFAWNLSMIGHKGHEMMGKTKVMLHFVLIIAVINIILNLLIVPQYGFIGSSFASMISFLLYPLFIYYSSKKYIRWKIMWYQSIKLSFYVLCSFIIVYILKINIVDKFPELVSVIIGSIVYFSLYSIILILSGEVNKIKRLL
jgi:O-antigen/teichoic acid export membrane protein